MNHYKKGFTLIELLAVVVVLGIILIVSVPKIIKLIDDSFSYEDNLLRFNNLLDKTPTVTYEFKLKDNAFKLKSFKIQK